MKHHLNKNMIEIYFRICKTRIINIFLIMYLTHESYQRTSHYQQNIATTDNSFKTSYKEENGTLLDLNAVNVSYDEYRSDIKPWKHANISFEDFEKYGNQNFMTGKRKLHTKLGNASSSYDRDSNGIKRRVTNEEIADTKDTIKDIWILGLFPFSGSWAGGLGQLPAVRIALDDINADSSILPGFRLRMSVNDTQCHAGIGTNAMYEQLYTPPAKLMILGAGCSIVSQATAQASYLWNLVQLSYSSASPALSKKDVYRRFYRVFPPESSFNPAKFALLRAFNWRKVGLLHQTHELFSLTNEDFEKEAPQHGVDILTSESFVSDPTQSILNLKKSGARIIIGNFYEDKARRVFCEVYKQQMFGSRYVWIITGFYSDNWWRAQENDHDCTVEELTQALQGYFTADALPSSLDKKPGLAGKTYEEFISLYRNVTNDSKLTGYQEAPYGYDSAWAVAMVLNTSLNYMASHGWNRSLEDFQYNDKEMADLFLSVINTTQYEGVSGPVLFDEKGDRKGLTQIEQLQGEREVRVGVYFPSSTDENLSSKKYQEIDWDGNNTVLWNGNHIPSDSIAEKIVPRLISFGFFVVITVLGSLGIVLSIIFLAFNIKFSEKRYIKMSSPNMNNVILAGAILAFLAMILGGAESIIRSPSVQLVICKFYNWTLALSFSLAFGAMFSKTWRVHKIFTNKKIQRMVIKDYQLLGLVCVLVGVDVIILTAWEFLDPLRISYYNFTLQQKPDPMNDNQVLIPQTRFCESPHMWYFAGLLCAIKGLLLIFGAFLAFETRKVTVPALNDSKFIGLSVYNISLLCMVGVPVSLLMKENIDAGYVLISLFIFFATLLTLCLVFIPKVKHRNLEPHPGMMFNKQTVNGRHNSKGKVLYMCTDTEIVTVQEENDKLKKALELCQRRLRELETCNGFSDDEFCHNTPNTDMTLLNTTGPSNFILDTDLDDELRDSLVESSCDNNDDGHFSVEKCSVICVTASQL